jgi:hypothetical protein
MPQTVGQYLGVTKGPVIHQHAVSDEYRRRADEMGWGKLNRYCEKCERLPAWCECGRGWSTCLEPGCGDSPGLSGLCTRHENAQLMEMLDNPRTYDYARCESSSGCKHPVNFPIPDHARNLVNSWRHDGWRCPNCTDTSGFVEARLHPCDDKPSCEHCFPEMKNSDDQILDALVSYGWTVKDGQVVRDVPRRVSKVGHD